MQQQTTLHSKLLAGVQAIAKNKSLYIETNFDLRARAIDYLEFHVVDRITDIDELGDLKAYTENLKHDLEAIDVNLFRQLRAGISAGELKGELLLDKIGQYFDNDLDNYLQNAKPGYDNLDAFFNGLLTDQTPPAETKTREPEMVFYQKTPARIILELIKRAVFKPTDVFIDIGSGLGQVSVLVNLLTGITAKGIEFEPAFCAYANACATGLNLVDVEFINTDAREADYATGTIFFMYTPFAGKMLKDVLQKLRREAEKRTIRVFTYGPCTLEVGKVGWLMSRGAAGFDEFGDFVSL